MLIKCYIDYRQDVCLKLKKVLFNNGDQSRKHTISMENRRPLCNNVRIKLFLSSRIRVFLREFTQFQNISENVHLIDTADYLYNRSSSDILLDAVKGILMLQTTYNLDVTKLTNADVKIQNKIMSSYTTRLSEKLTAQDFVAIGKQAFLYKWYDTSILYLLQGYNELIKDREKWRQFEASKELLRDVVAYHNTNLRKFGSSIGENWKLFDFMVHLGIQYCITIFCT